jgi:hypothetical protein
VKLRFHSSNRPGLWTHIKGSTEQLCVGVRAGDGNCVKMRHFLTRCRKQKALSLGNRTKSVDDFEENERDRKPKREEGWKER